MFKFSASLFLIAFCFLSSSCKKDKMEQKHNCITLAGIYHLSDTIFMDPPIMYTASSSITDPVIISNYLSVHGPNDYFNFNSTWELKSRDWSINILNANDARIVTATDTIYTEITSDVCDTTVLSMIDSTGIQTTQTMDGPWIDIFKFRSRKNCYPMPILSNGIGEYCKFRTQFPIIKSNNEISIPLVTNIFVRQFIASGSKNMWNEFNTGILPLLKEHDTIVIQSKRQKLIQ